MDLSLSLPLLQCDFVQCCTFMSFDVGRLFGGTYKNEINVHMQDVGHGHGMVFGSKHNVVPAAAADGASAWPSSSTPRAGKTRK